MSSQIDHFEGVLFFLHPVFEPYASIVVGSSELHARVWIESRRASVRPAVSRWLIGLHAGSSKRKLREHPEAFRYWAKCQNLLFRLRRVFSRDWVIWILHDVAAKFVPLFTKLVFSP